jgi:hypothetical protein
VTLESVHRDRRRLVPPLFGCDRREDQIQSGELHLSARTVPGIPLELSLGDPQACLFFPPGVYLRVVAGQEHVGN